ncbi:hypothetical protein EDD18DRAFT_1107644 [Armillaria luteobubalina]|uniref:Secreted protein n=1 Tax=Armillaria luteobubalina TaxID=153913 RepID=A0AA39Q1N7_9AGAR|nr:hypothetical protein EDD18DRAFT_1107644 [Armillaria luteobubalina]
MTLIMLVLMLRTVLVEGISTSQFHEGKWKDKTMQQVYVPSHPSLPSNEFVHHTIGMMNQHRGLNLVTERSCGKEQMRVVVAMKPVLAGNLLCLLIPPKRKGCFM